MADSLQSKVFVGVSSSVATAGILWFTGLLPTIWNWSLSIVAQVWMWLFSLHAISIQGWHLVVVTVLLLTGIAFWILLGWKITPFYKNSPGRYRSDVFFGARWTWKFCLGRPTDIWCECPHCSTTLVYTEDFSIRGDERKYFSCETCGHRSQSFEGNQRFAISKIHRQIERKIKTGEYRKLI